MMDPAARRRLVAAHEFAGRCAENLHGHALRNTAAQLEIELAQELASNPLPGSKEVVGGATITHRPDLVARDGGVSGGMFPGEPGGYPPLRKDRLDGASGVTVQEPAPLHPAEPAVPGLVKR